MRKVVLFLVLGMLVALNLPAFAQTPSPRGPMIMPKMREVDGRLERAFHDVRAAAELIEKWQRGGQLEMTVYQALRSLAESEQKLDQARAMIKAMKLNAPGATPPTREQVERVERIVGEVIKLVRDSAQKIDAAVKKTPQDARRVAVMLKAADRNTDAAIKMLRQILASL